MHSAVSIQISCLSMESKISHGLFLPRQLWEQTWTICDYMWVIMLIGQGVRGVVLNNSGYDLHYCVKLGVHMVSVG